MFMILIDIKVVFQLLTMFRSKVSVKKFRTFPNEIVIAKKVVWTVLSMSQVYNSHHGPNLLNGLNY